MKIIGQAGLYGIDFWDFRKRNGNLCTALKPREERVISIIPNILLTCTYCFIKLWKVTIFLNNEILRVRRFPRTILSLQSTVPSSHHPQSVLVLARWKIAQSRNALPFSGWKFRKSILKSDFHTSLKYGSELSFSKWKSLTTILLAKRF